MKQRLLFLFLIVFTSLRVAHAQQQQQLTLEDIFVNNTFDIKSVPGFNPLRGDKDYTRMDKDTENSSLIASYDLLSGKKTGELLEVPAQVFLGSDKKSLSGFSFSDDERKILLLFAPESIYRRSIQHYALVYDRDSKKYIPISKEKILHPSFNKEGNKVAYVYKNNLYVYDLKTSLTTAITNDGQWNKIINGNCDWVYEEEFEFTKAYQWSPDGQHLAYYRFDESHVKEYSFPVYDSLYPTNYTYKYPKAGEENSKVDIYVYNLANATKSKVDLGLNFDQYVPRIKWANAQELLVYKMNRLQNHLAYLFYNTSTGITQKEFEENNPYFIKIEDNLTFYQEGQKFVFTSEDDGHHHAYSYNRSTKTVTQITKGDFDIDKVLGFNGTDNALFFTAGKSAPTERGFYKIKIGDKAAMPLANKKGWYDVVALPSLKYFVLQYSTANSVPIYTLVNADGRHMSVLEDNKTLAKTLSSYALQPIKSFTMLADDGTPLNGWVIEPPKFDESKKYPVLMYQYSGPGSQEVKNRFPLGNYFWHQYMAQLGYIIVCVDGRGTGARGQKFEKSTYLTLGDLESNDQIAVAKQLAALPYVDKARIGIWGWSYGGFMSATCILKGADVFKTAVAVAPVTNWRFYDNIYTERYMRTPQENASGYDQNAPEKMAAMLKGNLLIIHGTADDNVHFQNAVQLTSQLIKNKKQFQSFYYPDKNHSINGGATRYQLFTKITEYLRQNL